MHPTWGGYGGGPQPPPHFGPRFRGAQPPPPPPPAAAAAAVAAAAPAGGGGFGGYGAPSVTPSSNFSSLHEQHLQQMQQLQQLHQKQLQSVLHHPANSNTSSSGPSPYWQAGGAGHPAPPNNFQDPSTLRGPGGPPQPQPPPPEVKPPASELASSSLPAAPQVSDTSSSVADEKPDFSSMSQQASFSCISSSSYSSSYSSSFSSRY